MRLHGLFVCLAVVSSVLTACVAQAPTNSGDGFRAVLSQDWKYWMEQYPEAATQFGYAGQNARWTDYSDQAIGARNDYLRNTIPRLDAIDRARLPVSDQLNYDLYRDAIAAAVEGLQYQYDAMPIRTVIPHDLRMPMNQLEGVQQDIPRNIGLMPAASAADYQDIVKRLQAAPALIDQTVALMKRGLSRGFTPPRMTFRDVPDQVKSQIVADPLKSPLLSAFASFPAAVSAADRDRLTAEAAAAYTTGVKPAFQRLYDFLTSTYLPACRETTAATALPSGDAMYAYNVRWHTTTALTPKEIHEIGLAEVKRLRAEMDGVMAKVGFNGSFDDFKKFLRTNPSFFYKDAGSLLAGYRDVAKRADPELAHLFGLLPRTPYGVVPVPDAIAPSQTTAYYEPGALLGRPARQHEREHLQARRPAQMGDGGADAARGGARASPPDRAGAGAGESARLSQEHELHRVRRRLGAVF